ncbi:MAG: GNAT family N-acetyltransferase [Mycobacteriales bacterium]
MQVSVVRQPPALHERAVALVGGDPAHPPSVPGHDLADLLPDGLVPGRGWPQPDDLVGIATSPDGLLIVVGSHVAGGTGPIGVPDDGMLEIGYGLAPAYRGQGVATTAVGLLCADLFCDSGIRAISAEMLEGNVPSWRLVERLGFRRRPHAERDGHRRYVLDRPADGPARRRTSALPDHPSGRAFGRDLPGSGG